MKKTGEEMTNLYDASNTEWNREVDEIREVFEDMDDVGGEI